MWLLVGFRHQRVRHSVSDGQRGRRDHSGAGRQTEEQVAPPPPQPLPRPRRTAAAAAGRLSPLGHHPLALLTPGRQLAPPQHPRRRPRVGTADYSALLSSENPPPPPKPHQQPPPPQPPSTPPPPHSHP